ncbi:MAG: hypothetical protein WC408_06790, partial [Candidatus Micrarchaeia archaeon]
MKGENKARKENSNKTTIAAVGIAAALIIVALAVSLQGQQSATVDFTWKSMADAQKAPDSEAPKSVEITVYQATESYGSYSQAYWNNGYRSTSQALSYNPSDGIALVKE